MDKLKKENGKMEKELNGLMNEKNYFKYIITFLYLIKL
jgi:hypothetical protein